MWGKLILIAIIIFLLFIILSLAFYWAFGLFIFKVIVAGILERLSGEDSLIRPFRW